MLITLLKAKIKLKNVKNKTRPGNQIVFNNHVHRQPGEVHRPAVAPWEFGDKL